MTEKPKYDRRKRLRPAPDNRDEAVARIVDGLNRHVIEGKSFFDAALGGMREFIECVEPANFPAYYAADFCCMDSAFQIATRAVCRILNDEADGWQQFALASSYAYWGQTSHRSSRTRFELAHDLPFFGEDSAIFHFFHAVTCMPEKIARPWAHHLYNTIGQAGARGDEDFYRFAWILIRCYCERRWLTPQDLSPDLADFAPLLNNIGQPTAFADALVDYCDFRLSRAYGFLNRQVTKATSGWEYTLGHQWFAIFPVELLGLRTIYQQLTGKLLSLDAPHPLLQTTLMAPPDVTDLPMDELLQKVVARSADFFAQHWQPDACAPLLPPIAM